MNSKSLFLFPSLIGVLALISTHSLAAQTLTTLHNFTSVNPKNGENSDGARPDATPILIGNVIYGTAYAGGAHDDGTVFSIGTDGKGFKTLHSFSAPSYPAGAPTWTNSDGGDPVGLTSSGTTLYGTAYYGGSSYSGTLFSVNTDGTDFQVLYRFTATDPNYGTNKDGANPETPLVFANGALYGTTSAGGIYGNGTVFQINADGTGFTTLHEFMGESDGGNPYAIILSGNTLYGTTKGDVSGTIFAVNTNGEAFTTLYNFSATEQEGTNFVSTNNDGAWPENLVLAGNTLFGGASGGGKAGNGTIFAINTDGTQFRVLYSFSAGVGTSGLSDFGTNGDGGDLGNLALWGNTLYGTTELAGPNGYGTVFALDTNGNNFEILDSFATPGNKAPFHNTGGFEASGVIVGNDMLYGGAYEGGIGGEGTIFELPLAPAAKPTVLAEGDGTIAQEAWPENLIEGQTYTITAVPKPNNVFVDWVGGTEQPYSILSTTPTLKFTNEPNLVLEANFVSNPFIPEKGTFNGLFLDTNNVTEASSGFFTLNLMTSGAFTGKIMTFGGTYSLPTTAKFDVGGQVEFTIPTKVNTLTFNLQLNISDPASQQITGTVSDGIWTAGLTADRAVFNATANKAANYEGRYTLAITGSDDAAASPGGFGCATLSVTSAGLITMTGNLADGAAMSQTVSVSKDGRWPFYASYTTPPTGNGGAAFGWITFSNLPASALGGTMYWFRPAGKTPAVYQRGFTNTASIVGSAFNPTDKLLLALTSGQVTLNGGNLPFPITNQVTLSPDDTIIVLHSAENTNKLALTITKSTGAISGSFANPFKPKQTITVKGVLLPNQTNAVGYFLGTNQSGAFLLESP